MLTLPLNRPPIDYEPKSLTWDSDVLPYRDKEKFLVALNIVQKKFHKKYPECQLTLTESTHPYFEFTWDDTQPLYEYSYISFELVYHTICRKLNENHPDLQTTTKGRSEVQIKTEKGFLSKLFQFFNRK